MSVNEEGKLVPRRVTGWHASPLGGRSVYRLTYASAKRAGAGRLGIELTGDHRVLTERGYVAAADLQSSDRVATGQGLSDSRGMSRTGRCSATRRSRRRRRRRT